MAGLLAIAIVLLAAVQVQSLASRQDVNDVRLDDLSKRLSAISDNLAERQKNRKDRLKELVELTGRVDDLKDHECGKRSFRCATRSKFCVHDILVCDGGSDCPDGSDEKECNNPAPAGTTMHGDSYNVRCSAKATPKHIRMDVIGEKKFHDFPSVLKTTVRLTFTLRDDSVRTTTHEAVYSFGLKKIVVKPLEGDSLAMVCTFRTQDSDFCHAEFISTVSENVCGEAVLVTV